MSRKPGPLDMKPLDMKHGTAGKQNMAMGEKNPESLVMKYVMNIKYNLMHSCRKK